jgi:hypothetical protein
MAQYHLSVKTVSRSSGRSAPAAAAYRSGTMILNERDGVVHDYRGRGGVHRKNGTFIVAPEGATWALDRAVLWNAAEKSETRKNSTLAREYELGLAHELSQDERISLCRRFAEWLVAEYGVAVDVAIHEPSRSGDHRNWHAHILTTTRTAGPAGLGPKTRILDDRATGPIEVERIRATWAAMSNAALESAGVDERVTHLAHRARGLDQAPTRHLGPAATAIERREKRIAAKAKRAAEIASDVDKRNQEIQAARQALIDEELRVEAELAALEAELAWVQGEGAEEEREKARRAEQARRDQDELRRQETARTRARKATAAQETADEEAQAARAHLVVEHAPAPAVELAGAVGARGDGLMVRPPAIWDGMLRWSLRDGERWYSCAGQRLYTERDDRIFAHETSDFHIDALLTLSAAKWPEGFEITGDGDFVARVIARAALRPENEPAILTDPQQRAMLEAARARLWNDDGDDPTSAMNV